MSLFRRFFYRRPPDGLLEITERVYVFDSCFSTDVFEDETYKIYMRQIATQLHEQFPESSFLVFNFREGEKKSQLTEILSQYDMTVMDYPRQYEGCPLLSMEMIHHFLRSSDSWLSLEGHQNIVLMHCERGGWPLLAFILSCFLIYRKLHTGEQRTMDMLHREAPKGLLHLLSPLNPMPSQLRYLQYVARRKNSPEWPPPDRSLTLDCLMLRVVPSFDSAGGCRPLVRIYGRDTHSKGTRATQMLFSLGKKNKLVRHYRQVDCDVVKIDVQCPVQGDVVLECIHLESDCDREEMMFRVMFNTAFIRSNILILYRDDIDILWNAKERFTKDFRAEVLFGELDIYSPPVVPVPAIDDEEKGGLPIEAFARVQELFNSGTWDDGHGDAALRFLQQQFANVFQDKIEASLLGDINGVSLLSSRFQPDEDSGFEPPSLSSSKVIKSGAVTPISILHSPHPRTPASLHRLVAAPGPASPSSSIPVPFQSSGATSSTPSPVLPICHPSPPGGIALPPSQLSLLGSKKLPPPPPPPLPPRLATVRASPPPPPPPPLPAGGRSLSLMPHPSLIGKQMQSVLPRAPGGEAPSSGGSKPSPLASLSHPLGGSEKLGFARGRASPPPPPPPPPLPFSSVGFAHPLRTGAEVCFPLDGQATQTVERRAPPQSPNPPPPMLPATLPLGRTQPSLAGGRAPPPPPPPPPAPLLPSRGRDQANPSGLRALPPPPPPPPPPGGRSVSITFGRGDPAPMVPPLLGGKTPSLSLLGRMPPPPPPPPPGGLVLSQLLGEKAPVRPPVFSSPTLSPGVPGDKVCSGIIPPPPPPISRGRGLAAPPPPPSGRARGLAAPPPPPPGGRSKSVSLSVGAPVANASSVKKSTLKPLHWVKVTRAVQGSLWAENQKQEEQAKGPEIDMNELESLFSNAVLPPAAGGDKANRRSSATKQEKIHLIDLRRANNCEIMLTKIKMPMQDMLNAVLNLDGSVLDMDQVENLIKFCPTKEEMDMLKGFAGGREMLGKAEQFFLEMMRVPRIEAKLKVFAFKISFNSQVSELRGSLVVVNEASREVRESVKLRRVMQTILSLGNALNQGTARGSAIGFKLDSLLKLTDTRARNNKMTLMHYLCKVVGEKLSELLDFHKDLIHLEESSKVQLKSMAEEMQSVSKGLEKIEQELTASENDGPISDSFREVLKAFLNSAEAEVRSLASLYSEVGRNADSLAQYFGEDPARCPFEQVLKFACLEDLEKPLQALNNAIGMFVAFVAVTSILLNFVLAFKRALEDNTKQAEMERKKASKEAEKEKIKSSPSKRDGEGFAKISKVAYDENRQWPNK